MTSLDNERRGLLERLLANEVDMAFRRRVTILLDYLELRDGARVLDCGCGMGFHLLVMERLWKLRLVGLDQDDARLRRAREHGVAAELVQGDAQELPFDDGSFDGVLMTEVLEHVRDDRRAIAEAFRVLRPGGILAGSVPHAQYPFLWDPINKIWTGIGRRPIRRGPVVGIWTNHERLYTPEDLRLRVREAGLSVEELTEATHYCFPFTHFLVYGIGKPLVEHRLLPERLRVSADRFSGLENAGSPLNPFNAARSLVRAVDRLNERPAAARKRTFVNVLLKARKPAPSAHGRPSSSRP
jgi:SAM-dependent methyltransferase